VDTAAMLTAATRILKQNLEEFAKRHDSEDLTPELAEEMMSRLRKCMPLAATAIYKVFLESLEDKRDIIEVNGDTYRFKCNVPKEYETFFGKMSVVRRLYQDKSDGPAYFPLDEAWGMRGQYATEEVREAFCFSCAHVTPEETAAMLRKTSMFHPHATAIKHVIERAGDTVAAHRDGIDMRIRAKETLPGTCAVLVASLDGATVLLNEKGTKLGRPGERPGVAPCGETPTSYKVAMVGSVSFYGAAHEEGKTPPRLASHYTAHMPQEHAETFKARFEQEVHAAQALCGPGVEKMVLLDGARSLWKYVDNHPLFEEYIKVIDFFHATEHLSKIAELLFGKGTDMATYWYEKYRCCMRDDVGGVECMLRSVDYYLKKTTLSKPARTELAREWGYFLRNKARMNYGELRARGLPIGSGPVEAACKTLVKTRLCRSGMRWSRKGGQRILDFRTYVKSNRWDEAWQEIKTLEKAA
jgi:hypothetical protein